jgi:phosphoglycolate phosphatase-like HAD superfamily hydrolase
MGAKFPLYVGDSPDDCEAAGKAGMVFIAIGSGKKKQGEFARFKNAEAAIKGLFS